MAAFNRFVLSQHVTALLRPQCAAPIITPKKTTSRRTSRRWDDGVERAMAAAWNEAAATETIRRHGGREGAMLPILHDLQAAFGCISPAAVRLVAHELNLTRAE